MKTINDQQEEYRAFLKNIREEREESSNLVKLVMTLITAILCAVIVCVILVENNLFLKMATTAKEDTVGVFKYSRTQKNNFEVPFSPKRQNILILGVDSNGQGTDMPDRFFKDAVGEHSRFFCLLINAVAPDITDVLSVS